jgi:hypothetical protein
MVVGPAVQRDRVRPSRAVVATFRPVRRNGQ